MFLDRFRKKDRAMPSFDPDRYEIKIKRDGEWQTVWQDGDMPKDPEDIPDAIYEPGQRYAIWDRVDKRWLGTIKTPGKKKEKERSGDVEREKEKRDPGDKFFEEATKFGQKVGKFAEALNEIKKGFAVFSSDDEIKEELRALRAELAQGHGKNELQIPQQILDRLPGWSLLMYYPPTQVIKELKDAGKEILEHAIKTAKGELPGIQSTGEESVLEKFKKKRRGGGLT